MENKNMTASSLDPKAALLVVDLQKAILGLPAVHPIDGIVNKAVALAEAFRARSCRSSSSVPTAQHLVALGGRARSARFLPGGPISSPSSTGNQPTTSSPDGRGPPSPALTSRNISGNPTSRRSALPPAPASSRPRGMPMNLASMSRSRLTP
jgi:hypothetical protein